MSNSVSRFYPKNNQDTLLREETLCPRPPETSDTALSSTDELDGGISYIDSLRAIQSKLKELSKVAFEQSIINDDEAYSLLSINLELEELITKDTIIDRGVNP